MPLVDFDGCLQGGFHKRARFRKALHHGGELWGTDAFRAGGEDEDATTRLDDVAGSGDTLNRLVVGEVERVAGGGGDSDIGEGVEAFEHGVGDIGCPAGVGEFGVSGEDLRDATVACEGDVDHEVVAGEASDFEEFAVEGVVGDGAFNGAGIAHELWAMDDLDRFLRGEAGSDEFTTTGEAEHKMRFDESEGDVEIGIKEAAINEYGCSGGGETEGGVFVEVFGAMVFDADGAVEFGADDFAHFVRRGFAVEPGGDEDDNVVAGDTAFFEAGEEGWKYAAIGGGAGDVADRNSSGPLTPGELRKRGAADRGIERSGDGRGIVGQPVSGAGFEKLVVVACGEANA